MKIGIIGAGSIGLLFASYLSRTFSITIYTRTREQATEITEHGVCLLKNKSEFSTHVSAVPVDLWDGSEDLTIIAVKQYQLTSVIEKINSMNPPHLNLLFLQNGMGHIKYLSQMKANTILVGTVEHGAIKENAYTVRQNGEGLLNLAAYRGDGNLLVELAGMFPQEFPVTLKDDYYQMLLEKLMINASINPLTSILKVRNGDLVHNDFYFLTLKSVFEELVEVLNINSPNDYFHKIIYVCENTANNHSSMLKDIEMGRKTEIEAILGFVIEEAERQNKRIPIITSLYQLVKGKELNRER